MYEPPRTAISRIMITILIVIYKVSLRVKGWDIPCIPNISLKKAFNWSAIIRRSAWKLYFMAVCVGIEPTERFHVHGLANRHIYHSVNTPEMAGIVGIEPTTRGLTVRHSTDWVIFPYFKNTLKLPELNRILPSKMICYHYTKFQSVFKHHICHFSS